MANVLIDENFLIGMADNIRAKTGRTEKIKPSEMLTIAQEEWGSGDGGTAVKEVVLEEQTIDFTAEESGYWYRQEGFLFSLVGGETYSVVWDGTTYVCEALDDSGAVALGNVSITSGDTTQDTGEPFVFLLIDSGNGITWLTTNETADSHTIAIYQESGGSSGGDSTGLVKYVTFMNYDGAKELYEKPTISGDDCVDVVAKGLMEKPTKESTNTTNYDHNGWALAANGSADSSALLNVTEDRTVYAAFAESTRYYTVNFYTEEGVLHESVQVEYGGTAIPSTTPAKKGYGFEGWSPSNENITADTDCYAVWVEYVTFANGSWADIAEISENGQASTIFAVGDEKIININGVDVTFVIAGFNHDDLADGSGKAGISIVTKNVPPIKVNVTNTLYRYQSTVVDKVFWDYLPEDLQNVIKPIAKECEASYSDGTDTVTCNYNLFPLSYHEVGCYHSETYITSYNQLGETYELYASEGLKSRYYYLAPDGTNKINVLCRGSYRVYGSKDLYITSNGIVDHSQNNTPTFYRIFGFCI